MHARSPFLGTLVAVALGCATQKNTTVMAPTEPAPAPAPKKAVLSKAAARLTQSPQAFAQGCTDDLTRAQKLLDEARAIDSVKETDRFLATFDGLQATVANVGAIAGLAKESHPDEALRTAGEKCQQEADKLDTIARLDRGLYDRLAAIDLSTRDEASRLWLDRTLKEMRRMGVDKDEATRAKVKALNEEITLLGQEFAKNIRDDVRAVELAPSALEGLPEDYRRAHPAQPSGKVKITTDTPDYMPFMVYAKDAKARESLWRTYRQRGYPKNLEVLSKLIGKRHELATLVGYPSWAAYVTESKMVKTAEAASSFIDEVTRASELSGKREYAELLALKKKDAKKATQLDPWDYDLYTDRYKALKFGFDSQAMRPYFEYSRVLAGVLDITSRMFAIRYEKVTDAATWHPDVLVYDVHDASGLLGRIYLDMHPRPGKYKHAAQFSVVNGQKDLVLPEGALLCNFPRSGEQPGLMQPTEVETFFHEFGHLLHHVFAGKQKWAAQSGVATEWDFVEAPSMLLQEWATLGESLTTFAKHHQTGEPVPTDLVQRMVAAKEFGKGLYTRRQMFLSAVSLNYYNRAPGFDTTKLGTELQAKFTPFRIEYVDGSYFQTAFGHLDGYSAIYYTYIWSSVIARDMLTVFKAEGVLNPATAQRYRERILNAGGSREAALLVQDFLGRPYGFASYEKWLNSAPEVVPSRPSSELMFHAYIELSSSGEQWTARVGKLKAVEAQGSSQQEALQKASDALGTWLTEALKSGKSAADLNQELSQVLPPGARKVSEGTKGKLTVETSLTAKDPSYRQWNTAYLQYWERP